MADPRVQKLAQTLVEYSVKVKPGDWVVVSAHPLAEELAAEVVRYTLRSGGNPSVLTGLGSTQRVFLEEASEDQLKWLSPFERLPFEQADVFISLDASDNTRNLSMVDSQKQQTRSVARREIMQAYMRRSASGELRWTLTRVPCQAYAQEADMSLSDYEDFVYRACKVDQADPVALWNQIEADQKRLVDWLQGKKQVHLRGGNIDIQMSIEGRTFVNSTAHHNMPGSEIFTGPVEDSVQGWVSYTYPAIYLGREVDGIRLEFKDGKVVNATAEKNEEYLLKMLDMDAGARFLGELGIGTNFSIDRFTKSILYDEKMGGTIHMALGMSYPETGGKNQSSLHWDMICDMRNDSEILVDGELFYKNGEFQV
ncbi:MAG: aminopeptidase [Anaerolineales bacterium]|nr:MAG: aminopeptidase [Anaerolineales bacterium]